MKRWMFHVLLAFVPTAVAGFVAFITASPLEHDVRRQSQAAVVAAAVTFGLIFLPLSFKYGFSIRSRWAQPYRGNLIEPLCRLFNVKNSTAPPIIEKLKKSG